MLWACADNQPEEGYYPDIASEPDEWTKNDVDSVILRWVDYSKYLDVEAGSMGIYDNMSVNDSPAFTDWYKGGKLEFKYDEGEGGYSYYLNGVKKTAQEIKQLVFAFHLEKKDGEYANFRPGDVFVDEGHALIYVGNGVALDCVGAKYDVETGKDKKEGNGAVANRSNTVTTQLMKAKSNYAVVRPLEFYAQDFDGNMANDVVKYDGKMIEVPQATKSRMEFPAMEINRTVDITPYGTIAKGENLTYNIQIRNRTTDRVFDAWRASDKEGINYEGLKVTEKIPEGTEFVSAKGDYEFKDGVLAWTLDLLAGDTVDLSYTVKATGEVGSVIVSEGGFVENIPSNSISNVIGEKKLNDSQKEFLTSLSNSENTDGWNSFGKDLEFAENVYKEMGVDLELPSLEKVVKNLFTPTFMEIPKLSVYFGKQTQATMYRLQKDVEEEYLPVKKMLINGYYGGYRFYATDIEKFKEVGLDNFDFKKECNNVILDFRTTFLEVGDIIVYATAKNRGDTDLTHEILEYKVLIYAGNRTLLCAKVIENGSVEYSVISGYMAEEEIVKCYINTNDLFFALRPSQIMDVSAS
jgi:hypothetical protein